MKRLAITACQSPPPITAGMLFIISEIFSQRPRAVDFLLKQEVLPSECTDSMIANSQNHDNDDGTVGTVGDGTYHFLGNFDAAKREPEYAVTDTNYSSASNDMNLWELSLLQSHYHPSVKAFSSSLLNKNNNNDHRIVYKGDPIQDFSLMAFLNRFSYKNPKTSDKIKGTHTKAAQEEPINLMDMNKLSSSIAGNSLENSDKQFFVKYFEDQQRLRDLGKTKKRSKYDNTDVDEESDEEAEIDKFADKLAQDLLRSAAANDDPDMDDFSDEDEDINMDDYVLDKDEGSDEESDVRDEIEDVDVDDDDSDVDFDEEIDGEEDSGSDDGFELQAYGDDDEEEEVTKSSKKEKGTKASKKRKTVKDDEFASAEDYEQEMEEIVQQVAKKKVKTDSR